jgi:hypothetical protein
VLVAYDRWPQMLAIGLRTTKHILDVTYAVAAIGAAGIGFAGLEYLRGRLPTASKLLVFGGFVLALAFAVSVVMTQFGHL